MRVLTTIAVVLCACTDIPDAHFSCEDGRCPSGFQCWPTDLRCHEDPFPGFADADLPDASDAAMDAMDAMDAPDAVDAPPDVPCVPPSRAVDLLLVIDNSRSMAAGQERLAEALPELVRALSTGQRMPGGPVSFDPVTDMHIGVVTTDLGSGGFLLSGCEESDDGVLITAVDGSAPGTCPTSLPPFLDLGSGIATLQDESVCKVQQGSMGCGFEQPLEAMLKAVTPSTSPTRFLPDDPGNADGANAGFLREDSVLVVLVLTDEEDCSVQNPQLHDPGADLGDLNLRCVSFHDTPGFYRSTGRYVDGLQALRPGSPERVVFAGLVGIPVDLEDAPLDRVLDDPRMVYEVEGSATRPNAACDTGVIRADPAVRIVETAKRLEDFSSGVVFGSMCQESYEPFARRLTDEIASALDANACE
ncbi:MAG: hypothetical protein AAGE52_07595 [Myxococcota bacterium]